MRTVLRACVLCVLFVVGFGQVASAAELPKRPDCGTFFSLLGKDCNLDIGPTLDQPAFRAVQVVEYRPDGSRQVRTLRSTQATPAQTKLGVPRLGVRAKVLRHEQWFFAEADGQLLATDRNYNRNVGSWSVRKVQELRIRRGASSTTVSGLLPRICGTPGRCRQTVELRDLSKGDAPIAFRQSVTATDSRYRFRLVLPARKLLPGYSLFSLRAPVSLQVPTLDAQGQHVSEALRPDQTDVRLLVRRLRNSVEVTVLRPRSTNRQKSAVLPSAPALGAQYSLSYRYADTLLSSGASASSMAAPALLTPSYTKLSDGRTKVTVRWLYLPLLARPGYKQQQRSDVTGPGISWSRSECDVPIGTYCDPW